MFIGKTDAKAEAPLLWTLDEKRQLIGKGPDAGKESACSARDMGSTPGLKRFSEEGKGYPLQYSGLENSMDSTVHGVTKSWTQLNDFHFSFRIDSFRFDLLAVQGTPKSLLQHHNLKASIIQHLAFFMVQLSHLYMTTGKP